MAVYTAIDDPEKYFQVKLYAGDSTNHALTFDGDSDMSPNWIWIKERDGTINYYNFDSVRGVGKRLQPNVNAAEDDTDSTWFQSFDSDGFSIGSEDNINDTGDNYAAWCWKATGSTASNTDGTNITSTIDANTTSGFSIVSWTGDNSGSSTVGHGLGKVAEVVIVKNRADAQPMNMKHKDMAANAMADFDGDAAPSSRAGSTNGGLADLSGTTTFGFIAGSAGTVSTNGASDAMIAYVFNSVQGFSKMGSYIGNGSTDGTFVYLGFRPAFVLTKKTSGSAGWYLWDNKRSPHNQIDKELYMDDDPETSGSSLGLDFLSNGFKWRASMSSRNESGGTYVYTAFAEAPLVNSEGVPGNAR